jgi:peptidoglycan/xylan/chitin deacetylase (PgdA/CDA1 family)
MITRRQFLLGCAGAVTAAAGLSMFPEYNLINAVIKSIPVLLYHRIGSEPDDLTVGTKRFEEDLEYLSREGYSPLTLSQIKQHLSGPSSTLPDKPVVITFDDGYLDNYVNAFPLLEKYSMKASFYIISGMIGQPNRMTASQIREMSALGMGFGSHTVSHRQLAELSPQEARTELTASKNTLEQILSKAVDFIAYPCGSYTPETLKLARETGYTGGFSVRPGFAMFNNCLAIRRIPIFHFDRPLPYVMLRKGLIPDIIG